MEVNERSTPVVKTTCDLSIILQEAKEYSTLYRFNKHPGQGGSSLWLG